MFVRASEQCNKLNCSDVQPLKCLPGADSVINFIEDMTGRRPFVYFKLCWKYIIPLLSLVSQTVFNISDVIRLLMTSLMISNDGDAIKTNMFSLEPRVMTCVCIEKEGFITSS